MSKPFEYGTEFVVTTDLYYNNFKFFDQLLDKKLKITHKEHGSKIGYFDWITWDAEPIPAVRANAMNYSVGDVQIGEINDGYTVSPPDYIDNSMHYGQAVTIGKMDYQDGYFNNYLPFNMHYKKGLSLEQAIKSRLYYVDLYFYLKDI